MPLYNIGDLVILWLSMTRFSDRKKKSCLLNLRGKEGGVVLKAKLKYLPGIVSAMYSFCLTMYFWPQDHLDRLIYYLIGLPLSVPLLAWSIVWLHDFKGFAKSMVLSCAIPALMLVLMATDGMKYVHVVVLAPVRYEIVQNYEEYEQAESHSFLQTFAAPYGVSRLGKKPNQYRFFVFRSRDWEISYYKGFDYIVEKDEATDSKRHLYGNWYWFDISVQYDD